MTFPILSWLIFLPLVGAIAIMGLRGEATTVTRWARLIAWFATLLTLALAVLLWVKFDASATGFQFVEQYGWLTSAGISYAVGVDGLALVLILLTAVLMPLVILASYGSVTERSKEYLACFLLLTTTMFGSFAALDLVLFYIFFEGVLIPMFLIIGIWGGAQRVYAAYKFFLYTLAGSLLLLLGVIVVIAEAGSAFIPTLHAHHFATTMQPWLWLAFFASFAVKVPMVPVHTWLPDAHVQAPTGGSVILAGVLLKMGGYGFLRFSLPLFPDASVMFAPLVFTLSIVAIIYTSLVALAQTDMKKLIAYSSIAHMGYVTLGIFVPNQAALDGAVLQMISHGVVSGALFLVVGVLYDRLHTRDIARFGGVAERMPMFALVFMLFMLASVGLPGTSGFVGEFAVLLGAFGFNTWLGLLAALGMVLGAAYMLLLYKKVMFGDIKNADCATLQDLSMRERLIFVPLLLLMLAIGLQPNFLLTLITPATAPILATYNAAWGLAGITP